MDPVNPEFTITVLEARIKQLNIDLEQTTKHANEGWALANRRAAELRAANLQNGEYRKALEEIGMASLCASTLGYLRRKIEEAVAPILPTLLNKREVLPQNIPPKGCDHEFKLYNPSDEEDVRMICKECGFIRPLSRE